MTVALCLLSFVATVRAVTPTWIGTPFPAGWNTGTNWTGGTAPSTISDTATFTGSTAGINHTIAMNGGNGTVGSITFTNAGVANDGFNFQSGNTLIIGGSAGGITNNDADTQVFNVALTLQSNAQTFNAASGGIAVGGLVSLNGVDLTLSGAAPIVLNGGIATLGAAGRTVTITNTGPTTISGAALTLADANQTSTFTANVSTTGNVRIASVIQDGSGTGADSFTKTGTGTLTISGANTYTGTTTVSSGTLKLGSTSALGSGAGTTSVATGAVLDLNGFTLSSAEAITLSGNGTGAGALVNSGGSATYSGAVTLGATDVFVGGTGNINLSGAIGNGTTGNLTKVGSNTITLSGNNTYTGLTTVSAGTLQLGSTTALGTTAGTTTVSSGASLDLGGITLGTADALTLNGTGVNAAGALTNTGGAATYNGALTLATASTVGGTGNITLTGATNGNLALTKEGTNTLTFNAADSSTSTLTINQGTVTASGGTGTLTGLSGITLNPNGTLVLDNSAGYVSRVSGSVPLTLNGGTLSYLSASAGNNNQTFGNATTLNGATTISMTSGAAGSKLTLGTLTRNSGGTLLFSGDTNFGGTTEAVAFAGGITNVASILPFAVVTKDGGSTYNFATNSSAGASGTITAFTAYQAGGNSTWTANTVNARPTTTQTLAANKTLSSLALDTGVNVALGTSTLTLGNSGSAGILQTGGTSNITAGTGVLAFGNREAIFEVYNSTTTGAGLLNEGAAITGSAGLTKSGSGTLNLTAASSSLTGNATLNQGTLRVAQANSLGTTGTLIINGGTLQLSNNAATSFGYNTTVKGDATILSDVATNGTAGVTQTLGTLALGTGTNGSLTLTIDKGPNVSGGAPVVAFNTTTLAGSGSTFNVNSGATLNLSAINGNTFGFNVAGAGNTNISGAIGITTGGLTMNGTGNLTLSAASTYTGATTINSGTLNIGTNNALSASSISVNGGTLALGANSETTSGTITLQSGNITGGTLIGASYGVQSGNITSNLGSSSAALTNTTAGTVTLTGTNAYTGGTVIEAGTLQVGTGGTAGSLSSTGTIVDHGSLVYNLSSSPTVSNTITGSGNLTQAGSGTLTLSGTNSFTGGVTVGNGTNGNLTITTNTALGTAGGTNVLSGSTLTLAGGTTGLETAGNGLLTLNGTATLTDSGSTSAINNRWAGNITIAGGANATINSTVAGNATAGYLALGITTAAYNRAVSDPLHLTPVDTTTLTLNAGSNLNLTGVGTIYENAGITGSGNITIAMTNSADSVSLTARNNSLYTGTTTVASGTLNIATLWNSDPTDAANHPFYFALGNSPGTLVIGNNSSSSIDAFVKTGSGSLNNELLSFNQAISLNRDGQLATNNTQSIGALTFLTGGNVDVQTSTLFLNGDVTVNASAGNTALIQSSTGNGTLSLTIHQGNVTVPNVNRVFNVGNGGNASDLTISNVIVNGGITKTGTGIMTLTGGNNTYEMTTNVNNGTLAITNGGALGLGGNQLSQGTVVNTGGTLQLSNNITVTGELLSLNGAGYLGTNGALRNASGNNTWAGSITLGDGSPTTTSATVYSATAGNLLTLSGTSITSTNNSTLVVDGPGDTTITSGIGTGNGGVTKNGTGTLILSGSSTYGGNTTINTGVLRLMSSNGLGSAGAGTTVSGNGSALQLAGGITTLAEPLTLNGTGVSNDGALRNFSGNNTFAGAITVGTGGTRINADSGTLLTLNNAATITSANQDLAIGGVGNTAITGNVSLGTGAFTKDGSGTATFSATTSIGNVTMNGGTLNFSPTYANTSVGNVTINAGTTTFSGNGTMTGGAVTVTTGTLNFLGASDTVGQVHLQGGATSTINVGTGATLTTNEFDSAASTTLAIASGGTVVAHYGAGTTTTFSGQITGYGGTYGTFSALGAGTVVFDHSISAVNNPTTPTAGITLVIGGTSIGTMSQALTVQITNSSTLQFQTIHITGDTILDFGNSSASILNSSSLIIDAGVKVSVINWVSLSDAWYATTSFTQQTSGNTTATAALYTNASSPLPNVAPENQITYSGFTAAQTAWVTNTAGAYNNHEIRPVPEPATYGVILLSSCVGLLGLRRYLRHWRTARV